MYKMQPRRSDFVCSNQNLEWNQSITLDLTLRIRCFITKAMNEALVISSLHSFGQSCLLRYIHFTLVQGDTVGSSKPPADFRTKVPFLPGLAWPGQSGTFVLKSTEGLELPAVSPCTLTKRTSEQLLAAVQFDTRVYKILF